MLRCHLAMPPLLVLTRQACSTLISPLAVLPLTFLTTALTNPTPAALQPAFTAATLVIFFKGWLPHIAGGWQDARLAAASMVLCARVRLAVLFAEAAASGSFW